jgi:MFS transporter, DHA1 family, multidrug resistance protein
MQAENILDLSARRVNLIILLILSVYPLLGMAVDLIAPSLPAISRDLQVSHTVAKNLVAIYLLGYSLGSFIIGFLSDALGRRKFLTGGLLLFTLASLLPTFFPNPQVLLLARLLQGLAIAAIATSGRPILADILTPEKLIHVNTLVATMWGIGPIVGPVIGGYLQYYFNWQAGFYFFAVYSFLTLVAAFFLVPETHHQRQALNFSQLRINLISILKHRLFMGATLLMGLTYSLLIVFNTLGPFLIQNVLAKTPVYFGHLALIMGCVFLIGTITCRRLVKIHPPEKMLARAVPVFLVIAVIGLILAYVDDHSVWIIAVPSAILFFGTGIIYPASMGKGSAIFRHLAGSGTAVMNLINILITSLTAFLMSFVTVAGIIPIAWIYVVLLVLCGLIYWFLIRQRQE